MGELEVLTCVYCGADLEALPLLEIGVEKPKEILYHCVCGGTATVALGK